MEETMPVSKAQQKARDKYLEKFEEIRARVPKGRKDEIKRYAESCGESVNSFIGRAISEAMQRDTATDSPAAAVSASGTVTDIPAPETPKNAAQAVSEPAIAISDIPLEKWEQVKAHAEARREPVSGFLVRAIDEAIKRDTKSAQETGKEDKSDE